MQCTCIALMFLCLHSLPDFEITTEKIDVLMQYGTDIFVEHIGKKFDGTPRYLLVNELPQTVAAAENLFEIKKIGLICGIGW